MNFGISTMFLQEHSMYINVRTQCRKSHGHNELNIPRFSLDDRLYGTITAAPSTESLLTAINASFA